MATINKTLETLEALAKSKKAKAEMAISDYAKAYNAHERKAVLKARKSAAQDAVKAYNEALACATYQKWANEGNPVLTALRERFIRNAMRVQFKTDDDDYMVPTITVTDYKVDLFDMHAVLGGKIFQDPKWFTKMEQISIDIYKYLRDNGSDEDDKETIAYESVSGIKEASGDNITNAKIMVSKLQQVFDAILIIPDAKKKDKNKIEATRQHWTHLREWVTSHGDGEGTTKVANPRTTALFIVEIMHLILTSGSFRVVGESNTVTASNIQDEASLENLLKDENDTKQEEVADEDQNEDATDAE